MPQAFCKSTAFFLSEHKALVVGVGMKAGASGFGLVLAGCETGASIYFSTSCLGFINSRSVMSSC